MNFLEISEKSQVKKIMTRIFRRNVRKCFYLSKRTGYTFSKDDKYYERFMVPEKLLDKAELRPNRFRLMNSDKKVQMGLATKRHILSTTIYALNNKPTMLYVHSGRLTKHDMISILDIQNENEESIIKWDGKDDLLDLIHISKEAMKQNKRNTAWVLMSMARTLKDIRNA